ncbi:MAG: hypothetical protein ISN28_15010 [Ectothiorhodospiraceae bacterium AqS1]|nr:hypothetical protein [Ectothiorhodospiraceae bacterium AqS1]
MQRSTAEKGIETPTQKIEKIDLSEEEVAIVRGKIEGRWRNEDIDIHLADVEFSPEASTPTRECPAIFWQMRGCNFLVVKLGIDRYRAEFFYSDMERYGVGIDEFSTIGECALTLLRIQADHESVRLGNFPGKEAHR